MRKFGPLLLLVSIVALAIAGCSHQANQETTSSPASATTSHDSHDGWWCYEHGVPEEVCARCSPKLVAGFKAKGDWCNEHERPESQCFICNPEREAEFAQLYEQKLGRKPPKPSEEEHEHSHDEHDHKSQS